MIQALLSYLLARDRAAGAVLPPIKPVDPIGKKRADPFPKNRRGRRARAALLKRRLKSQAKKGDTNAAALLRAMKPKPLVHTGDSKAWALEEWCFGDAQRVKNEHKRERRARR